LKKILIWLSILILIAGAIAGWFFPASGTIVGNRASELRFKIPGLVDDVYVNVGDRVKTGQLLASTDRRDLQRAVNIAKIALEQAELNLSSLTQLADQRDVELAEMAIQDAQYALAVAAKNRELATAQSALSNRMAREVRDDVQQVYLDFQKTLERYNLPYAYGAGITAANMEAEGNVGITALKGNYNVQQADSSWWATYNVLQQTEQSLSDLLSDVDNDRLKQTELQIEQAQLNVEQAQRRLEDTAITAPYDGTISTINITEGLIASGSGPAITIIDNNTLYTDVLIDEIDIGKIKLEQAVKITLDAYPTVELAGFVKEIEEVPSNPGGIISYKVRVTLNDQKVTQPRDGMTASVFIVTQTVEDILLTPNWAIRTDQTTTETYVYCNCLVDGVLQRTIIETGLRNDTHTQILAGLEEGAVVVLISEERNLFDFGGPPSFGE